MLIRTRAPMSYRPQYGAHSFATVTLNRTSTALERLIVGKTAQLCGAAKNYCDVERRLLLNGQGQQAAEMPRDRIAVAWTLPLCLKQYGARGCPDVVKHVCHTNGTLR